MDTLVFSNNPMTNGCKCLVCAICEEDDELSRQAELNKVFKPGAVVAVEEEKELPVYPDLDAIVQDTIEATFNPDIDKTCHFDLGDIDNLYIFNAMLLGDATPTAIKSVFTAKACIIGDALDMAPIRTEIRLKAAKYGKTLIEGQKSARELQKEEERANINYEDIMNQFNLGNMMDGGVPDLSKFKKNDDDNDSNIIDV